MDISSNKKYHFNEKKKKHLGIKTLIFTFSIVFNLKHFKYCSICAQFPTNDGRNFLISFLSPLDTYETKSQ